MESPASARETKTSWRGSLLFPELPRLAAAQLRKLDNAIAYDQVATNAKHCLKDVEEQSQFLPRTPILDRRDNERKKKKCLGTALNYQKAADTPQALCRIPMEKRMKEWIED